MLVIGGIGLLVTNDPSGGRGPLGTVHDAALIVDGRFRAELQPGDVVTGTAADVSARLVTFRPRNFHQILKVKFGLNDR